jgi:hypothetical protein
MRLVVSGRTNCESERCRAPYVHFSRQLGYRSYMNIQPRNAPVSEALKTQSFLANGDDKVHSLISVLATHRVGAMTVLQLTALTARQRFPIPRVTGVPAAPPALLRPNPRLQDARTRLSPARRVQGRLIKKRPGLSVASSNRVRMMAQGVSLAHIEAEVTWAPRQAYPPNHL